MRTLCVLLWLAVLVDVPFAEKPCDPTAKLSADQQQRRRVAVAFVRGFNTAQRRFHAEAKRWAGLQELVSSAAWTQLATQPSAAFVPPMTPSTPDGQVLPGFRATVITADAGYALLLRDQEDPCGTTLTTTHEGLIIRGAPLR